MARGKSRSEGEWRSVLEDYMASGHRQDFYCRERHISKASLYKWSKRLGLPLRQERPLSETETIDKRNAQHSAAEEVPFSFIELKVPQHNADAFSSLKLEILLDQERKVNLETTASWERVVELVKALVR